MLIMCHDDAHETYRNIHTRTNDRSTKIRFWKSWSIGERNDPFGRRSVPERARHMSEHAVAYVYRLVHKETGHVYIGSRSGHSKFGISPQDDLWKGYFSSSPKVKAMGYQKFDACVVAEFASIGDARKHEMRLIEAEKDNPLALNYRPKPSQRSYTNIRIDLDVWEELREYKAKTGIPIGFALKQAVKHWLDTKKG
jgi:hypothetical protein